MEKLKKFWEKFNALSITKKAILVFSIFFIAILLFIMLAMPDDENYAFLYRELSEEDAALIVEELKEMKVPYKITKSGNVMVPAKDVSKLRLSLAQKKLVGKGIGYEILDKQKYGMTSFMEQLNYLRALQGELSKTINQLNAVQSSRVHIVLPKKAIFKEDEEEARASVVLKLRKNEYLSKRQIDGILHLISGSVEGLKRENISIVDSYGKKLNESAETSLSNTPLKYQKKYEEKLTKQVQQILDRALGEGNSIVKIEAELDFDEKAQSEEVYDPDSTAVRSEKLQEELNAKQDNRIGGIPGATSNNAQNGTATGMVRRGTGVDKSKKSQIRNFEVSKVIKKLKQSLGKVKKISVAVLINGSYVTKKGKKVYIPRGEEELKTYLEIVKKAVGYNPERGDQVEVANVKFTDYAKTEKISTPFYKKPDFYFKILQYLFYIFIIVIVFLVIRSMLGWAIVQEDELDAAELEAGEEMKELAEGETPEGLKDGVPIVDQLSVPGLNPDEEQKEESLEMKLRRRINEIAYDNPDKVLQILKYWIAQH